MWLQIPLETGKAYTQEQILKDAAFIVVLYSAVGYVSPLLFFPEHGHVADSRATFGGFVQTRIFSIHAAHNSSLEIVHSGSHTYGTLDDKQNQGSRKCTREAPIRLGCHTYIVQQQGEGCVS